MEIQIFSPSQASPLPPVEWNYEAVKAWVEDGLAAYKGRVYDESSIAVAKKDRATLNKLADALDGKRKEMKSLYLKPFEEFEAQTKELRAMVKDQVEEIDAQVKKFESERKQEKLMQIEEMFHGAIGDLAALIPYERFHDPKWLNVTTSMTSIAAELAKKIEGVISGLAAIEALALEPSIAEQVTGAFLKDFDLAYALKEKERIEQQRAAIEAYNAAQNASAPEPDHEPAVMASPAAPVDDPIRTVVFKVEATDAQLKALKQFLITNNIKYGRA